MYISLPAIDHAVAVSQPTEAGHLVARRRAVEIDDHVVVGNQQLEATDHVADSTPMRPTVTDVARSVVCVSVCWAHAGHDEPI